jgi:hypothetical protein
MLSASEVACQRSLVAADGHIPFLAALRPVGLLGVSLHDLWHLSNAAANSTEPITIEDDTVVTSIVGSQNGLHVRNPYAKSLKAPPAYISETAVALGSKKLGSAPQRKPLTSGSSSSAAAYSSTGGSMQRSATAPAFTQRSMNMYLAATNSSTTAGSGSSAAVGTAGQQTARQMPTAAAATKDVFADTGSVYVGVQPTTAAAGNSAISSKYTHQFNSAFNGKTTAAATDGDVYHSDDYTAVEIVSASEWRTKADSVTRQPSELTRSLSEQLVAASKARLDALPQQQQQRSASIDSVISLNSSCSSNRSSSSTGSSGDAAKTAAAAVVGDSSEVYVIDDDDDDVSSDVSADVCSDVDDCITGLQSLQLIGTKQSSRTDSTTATTVSAPVGAVEVAASALLNAGIAIAKLQEADVAAFSDSDCDALAETHTSTSACTTAANSAATAPASTQRKCSECSATYTVVSASSICRCSLTEEDVTAYNALLKAAQAAEAICAVLASDDSSCDTASAVSSTTTAAVSTMNEEQQTALQQAVCAYMDCVGIWDGDSVLHDKIAALGKELGFNDCA